jgi:hypothetical protein
MATVVAENLAKSYGRIIDKPSDLNHTGEHLPILSKDAQYYRKPCEVLSRTPKDANCSKGNICSLIDSPDYQRKN